MEATNILDLTSREMITDVLMNLLRTGAQHLIETAVEVELESYLTQFASARKQAGHGAQWASSIPPFQTGALVL